MTLATILLFYVLSVGGAAPGLLPETRGPAPQDSSGAAGSQPQSSAAQTTSPGAAPAAQPQSSANPAKPSGNPHTRRKKGKVPDCSNSPVSGTTNAAANGAATANQSAVAPKPCPAKKVIVRNGGSDEPVVELKGSTSQEQASYQRFTTEQLTAATEENLKKVAGREPKAGEPETISQIKQFMEQAKSAVAAGDLVRGRNLALKARLLSDELVKP